MSHVGEKSVVKHAIRFGWYGVNREKGRGMVEGRYKKEV